MQKKWLVGIGKAKTVMKGGLRIHLEKPSLLSNEWGEGQIYRGDDRDMSNGFLALQGLQNNLKLEPRCEPLGRVGRHHQLLSPIHYDEAY